MRTSTGYSGRPPADTGATMFGAWDDHGPFRWGNLREFDADSAVTNRSHDMMARIDKIIGGTTSLTLGQTVEVEPAPFEQN